MTSPANAESKGVFGLRTLADWRAFIHVAAPLGAAALVGTSWVDNGVFQLVVTAVLALLSPVLAAANTTDKIRLALYAIVTVVVGIAIIYGYVNEEDWNRWLPVVALILGSGVAAGNTNTSADAGSFGHAADREAA